MSRTDANDTAVLPSATPSPDEIAAWESMTREQQEQALQAVFADPASARPCPVTMQDLLAQARSRADQRRG